MTLNDTQREQHMRDLFDYAFRQSDTKISNAIGSTSTQSRLCYDINLSGILTALIKKAGEVCESYASDMFISWQSVEAMLDDMVTTETVDYIMFGFRKMGVDSNAYIYCNMDNYKTRVGYIRKYYPAVYALQVVRNATDIRMELRDVTTSLDFWEFETPDLRRDITPLELYRLDKIMCRMGHTSIRPEHTRCESASEFAFLFEPGYAQLHHAMLEHNFDKTAAADLFNEINDILKQQEELADKNQLPYVLPSSDIPKTLEEYVIAWFQGKLCEFYYARTNNNLLLNYIAHTLKLEVHLL